MRLQNLNQFNRSLILNRPFYPKDSGYRRGQEDQFSYGGVCMRDKCRVNSCHSRCYGWASQWAGFDRVSKGVNELAFSSQRLLHEHVIRPLCFKYLSLSLIPHQPRMHHVFRPFVAWLRAFMVLSLFLQFIISKITFLMASLIPREKTYISVRDVACQ